MHINIYVCFFKTDRYLESVIQPWQSMFHKSEIVHLRSQVDKIFADLEIFLQGERPGRREGRDQTGQFSELIISIRRAIQ